MPAERLFVDAAQVVTCAGPGRARRGEEMRDAGILTDASVLVRGETIAEVGPATELAGKYPDAERVDCRRGVLAPGLVDSHTHAIFGAPRHEEQGMRAAGVGYMEIAAAGGGIHSSVRSVREASEDELTDLARRRLTRLASYGTTTVEVKSGYGLRVEDELKQLRVIARLAGELPLRLVPTWLGAHEIPPEARASAAARSDYIRMLVEEMLPRVVAEHLAVFADVFCEPGVFTIDETRYILEASKSAGLKLKLHADELEPSGAAELAAALGATSADHLAAISRTGVDALASSGTVATLLPGTMLFLGRGKQAPARSLMEAGAAVALATDFNPGTSPTVNLPLILTLGVSQLHMSPVEAIIAATVNGAAALGLADRVGQISAGYSADLALFEMEDVRELPYWYGERRCMSTWLRGKTCDEFGLAIS